ncbi:MAG: hypothetical protein AABZ32_05820 [Bacteroidota bacterium]
MAKPNISAALTAAQKATLKANVNANEAIINPFSVNLTLAERRKRRKVGTFWIGYVQLGLKVAQEHPEIIPADLAVPEYGKDVVLFSDTDEIKIHHSKYIEKLDDTHMAVGMEAINQTDRVYELAKSAEKRGNAAMTEIVKEFAKYFKKNKKKVPTPAP